MTPFLLKVAGWLAFAAVLHLVAASFADGTTDAFYLRFTGPQRQAMVVGTSRAAQAIDPSALNRLLPNEIQHPGMLNFGFTIGHSPYGPSYFKAIKKKLDPLTENGLFIVCVEPMALSIPKGSAGTIDGPFPEDVRMLGEQWSMNCTPNVEYLIRNYHQNWGSLIGGPLHRPPTKVELLHDGRLEVRLPNDEARQTERRLGKVEVYKDHAKDYEPSPHRISHLIKTLELLEQHGTVVLVRLPIHEELLQIEEGYWPGFSSEMEQLADLRALEFLDHTKLAGSFIYTDGNHIAAVSVPDYSNRLANEIGSLLKAHHER